MIVKLKKKAVIILLVLCYCAGNLLFPIYADNADDLSGFDELLSQRDEMAGVDEERETPSETRVSIHNFTDVKQNDWFYTYLDYLVEKQLVNGKTSDSFEPYSTFSYAECSAVIVRYLGLEDEAKKRMKEISLRDASLSNQWYLGYFEVLANLGIFTDYDLFGFDGERIVSVDKEAANSPIVRYRFAECISKSFELESHLKAKNVYSEIGGSGREFIVGGGYKEEILWEYESFIADVEEIPEESLEYVLKAYYNGIFNGDISGNFYPHNNLLRCEMAKVLATISDYSLRTRLVNDGYGDAVTEDMLHTDAFGNKTLEFDVWNKLLSDEAKNLSVQNGSISYKSSNGAPSGYVFDVYLYEKSADGYELAECSTLHDYDDGTFTYEADNARVLFVVRNIQKNAAPEGVLDVFIENGVVVSQKPNIRMM